MRNRITFLSFAIMFCALFVYAEKPKSISAATNRPAHWAQPIEKPGVPNMHKVSDTLYRSAQPTAEGMQELKKMGIRTIVNLRSFHSDRDEIGETGLQNEHIYMKAHHPEDKELVRFLQIVTDSNRTPVLVHCQHGADRTGTMCALYRIAVCGWSKDDAVVEMTKGGFGFHTIWGNLPKYIDRLDLADIRKRAGLLPPKPIKKEPLKQPVQKSVNYTDAAGKEHTYLVQEPAYASTTTPVFIYLYGAGGKEEQGMQLFGDLRKLLNTTRWIYVCPRDYEYAGLRKSITKQYGSRPLVLCGASAGGREAYLEATGNPGAYAAAVLLCPAFPATRIREQNITKLTMPVAIVCGENDPLSTAASRKLVDELKKMNRKVLYQEIPGGDHDAPLIKTDWPNVLKHIKQNLPGNKTGFGYYQ
jgi:protein tyrosine phosphatase (PTP) superfamily phosphohydrolase (DUF442 family)/dienelactone hydrolase